MAGGYNKGQKDPNALTRRYRLEYDAWARMRYRCNNPNYRMYQYYGGRGVTICERWAIFENFLNDVGPRPSGKYELDRVDPNGNYEPTNVKWIPRWSGKTRRSVR